MRYPPWTEAEDELLKKYAGVKSAVEIGQIIGRPKGGVHHRIKKLGLDGRLMGEAHHAFVGTALRRSMILTLYDAGYTPREIAISFGLDVNQTKAFCYDPSYAQCE